MSSVLRRLSSDDASPPPARDAMRPEDLDQPQFGGFVAGAADAGHDVRTLLSSEGVHRVKESAYMPLF